LWRRVEVEWEKIPKEYAQKSCSSVEGKGRVYQVLDYGFLLFLTVSKKTIWMTLLFEVIYLGPE
jgi:hypothetical protein